MLEIRIDGLNIQHGRSKLMAKNMKAYREPTWDEIAVCARRIYETQGRPEGKALDHWLQAEALLVAERKTEAGLPTTGGAASSKAPNTRNLKAPPAREPAAAWPEAARGSLHKN